MIGRLIAGSSNDEGAYLHNLDLLRAAERDRQVTEAFQLSTWETEARRYFRDVVSRHRLNRNAKCAGFLLAELAISAGEHLEIRQPLKQEIEATGLMAWGSMLDGLNALEDAGLIEVLERGSGAGRPYHIRLTFSDQQRAEISQRTMNTIARHLDAAQKRLQP